MIGMDISRQVTVSGVDEVEEEDALFFDFLDDDAFDVVAFLFFPDDDDDELEFDFVSSSS